MAGKKKADKQASHMEVDPAAERSRSTKRRSKSKVTEDDGSIYNSVELKLVSGGTLAHKAVEFSSDSRHFYVAKNTAVAVYNVENGEMVQSFAVASSQAAVNAVVGDAQNGRRVYAFTADARVRLWDTDSGRAVGEWELAEGPVVHAVADPSRARAFICAVRLAAVKKQRLNPDKTKYAISRITVGEQAGVAAHEELFRMTGALGVAVRGDGQWVAAHSKFSVVLAQVAAGGAVVHRWSVTERVSAVAFHPGAGVLAVGDWRGRIVFWHCVDEQLVGTAASVDRRVARHAHHWHAHRVNAIAFTEAGDMVSGGEEGVVVVWHLGAARRAFIPRLGSDITGLAVSPSQAHYAVTLRDNSVKIFAAATRALVASLRGLHFAQAAQRLTTGLVVHPRTRHVVLNGEPGLLQVYSPLADRHVASIEVAAFNRTGGTAASGAPAQPHVDLVQFSGDGVWMATADSRRKAGGAAGDARHASACFLKFWRVDAATQAYALATRIDAPHAGGVTALAFRPPRVGAAAVCASTGRDGALRVWEERGGAWACRAAATYRGQTPRAAAFSADGSVLAVAFGGAVTLWDADACGGAPAAALVASAATPALRGVAFVGAAFLAAWSAARLDVWNLATGAVWWTLAAPLQGVAVHPRAPLIAVAARQAADGASLLVLSPASPHPLAALPVAGPVAALALVPAAAACDGVLGRSLLVALTPAGLLNVYGSASESSIAPVRPPASSTASAASAALASIFSSPTAPPPASRPAPAAPSPHVRAALRLVRSAVQSAYAAAPHHVLPPVAALFEQFVAAQLAASSSADAVPAAAADDDDDGEDTPMPDAPMPGAPPPAPAHATVDDLWGDATQPICAGFDLVSS
ncbi:NET1-associated nuclear protein 1 [Coemansia thaxteri]|nr:NET1-associated nuclear protein 1 [Coemansia thaxteri]